MRIRLQSRSLAWMALLPLLLVGIAREPRATHPATAPRSAAGDSHLNKPSHRSRPPRRASLAAPRPTPTIDPSALYPSNQVPYTPTSAPCVWSPGVLHFTDADGSYYSINVVPDPHLILTLTGTYPSARYASFQVYDWMSGYYFGEANDTQWIPERTSVNPFVAGTLRGRNTYTVHFVFTPPTSHTAYDSVYINAHNSTGVTIIYRLYLPDLGRGPTGGVPLPVVTASRYNGNAVPCPLPIISTPPQGVLAQPTIVVPSEPLLQVGNGFVRVGGQIGGDYGNADAATLGVLIKPIPDLYVVSFTAPITPRSLHGEPLRRIAQLRYWSLCVARPRTAQTLGCVNDEQVPLDAKRRATIVLGMSAARPRNATATDGVEWIDLADFPIIYQLTIRQVLPSPTFTQSGAAVPPGASVSPYMGPYAPILTTCTTEQFEATRCA